MNFIPRTILTLFLVLITTLSAYSQQWISLSSDKPKPIDTELLQSSEEAIEVHLQVSGFYTFEVNTPQGKPTLSTFPRLSTP